MASAAEQLAASSNFSAFSKATELKQRIWFTLGALIVYRLGTYIPVPGVDASVMGEMLSQHGGGILGIPDLDAETADPVAERLVESARTVFDLFPIMRTATIVRCWAGLEATSCLAAIPGAITVRPQRATSTTTSNLITKSGSG